MEKIKIGIIGLGGWGECHLEACKSFTDADVVAVCDIRDERLHALADKWAVPHRYTDYEALLLRDDLDLVIVAVLEHEHLQPALQALRTGKHVLVEKPVTTRYEEAKQIMEEARRSGRLAVAGHLLRFEPRYAAIKQSIVDGSLGKPYSMYFRRSRTREMFQIYKRTHTAFETTVHDVDLAIWYAGGARVRSVRAFGRKIHDDRVPDILWSNIEFTNGMFAVLQSNWMTQGAAGIISNDAVEVICEHGTAAFDNNAGGFQIFGNKGRLTPNLSTHRLQDNIAAGVLCDQYAYLFRCIREGRELERLSFEDAVHGIQVLEAIVESAESGRDFHLDSY